MAFFVGQKVVRIKSGLPPAGDKRTIYIELGTVLTIRDIDTRWEFAHGVPTMRFEEVTNIEISTRLGPYELGYDPRGFRPVVERKTSIEIFQRMLTPKKEHINA